MESGIIEGHPGYSRLVVAGAEARVIQAVTQLTDLLDSVQARERVNYLF